MILCDTDIDSCELISVIMGVYNCEDTVVEAIQSVQNQTYKNWELIVCDDGSSDQTYRLVEDIAKSDARIKLIKNKRNLGLNTTLNNCLAIATGNYVARMDGDDRCSEERFEKQLLFLETHKDYAVCGSLMTFFDETGEWGGIVVPECPTSIDVVTKSPILHPTTMMRKAALDDVGWYSVDDKLIRVEDLDLWIKLYSSGYLAYNLQEPLYYMRNDHNSVARRKYKYRINSTLARLKGCRSLNLSPVCYIKAFKPMVYGLVPRKITYLIRHKISYRKH